MNRKEYKELRRRTGYKPTKQERAAILRALQKDEKWRPHFRLDQYPGGSTAYINHPVPEIAHLLLMEAIGTDSDEFMRGLISQVINSFSETGSKAPEINFVLSVIEEIKPRDQIEAMLATQIAAVHMAVMRVARQLADVTVVRQPFPRRQEDVDVEAEAAAEDSARLKQDLAERAFSKLSRTFATQIEALKRYRAGHEQSVPAENPAVAQGQRATVARAKVRERSARRNGTLSPAPSRDPRVVRLRRPNATGSK